MYPTLYHFIFDLTGFSIPLLKAIPMFGFWVGIAFIVASWLGGKELKRREKAGYLFPQKKTVTIGEPVAIADYVINGALGFFLGFKFLYFLVESVDMDQFRDVILSTKGNVFGGILGAIALVAWKYYEAKKTTLAEPYTKEVDVYPHEHMGTITMISVGTGILGAVLFATLEKPALIGEFLSNPSLGIGHLYNGLTVYGGVILAVAANIYFFRKNKLNLIQFLDALGPTVLLAYAIGRIGCHMAGDGDWGVDNLQPKPEWMSFLPDWLWAYDYPNNVNGEGIPMEVCRFEPQYCYHLANPVYPTPLYEIIMSTILFGIIWSLRKVVTYPLMIFSFYVIATGSERYLIEQIRVNTKYGSGFTQAELISIGLIIIGIGIALYSYFRLKPSSSNLS